MMARPYYTAYNNRYKQMHKAGITWTKNTYTPELLSWLKDNSIPKNETILEIGCGEGRDTQFLAKRGYNIIGIDVSSEAIKYCNEINKKKNVKYRKWDIIKGPYIDACKWIFAISVLHMLVKKGDRNKFLKNMYKSLCPGGHALLVNMGNGKKKYQSNISGAFAIQKRKHQETGKDFMVASTSCRTVNNKEHKAEITHAGFKIDKFKQTRNYHYAQCMTVYLRKIGRETSCLATAKAGHFSKLAAPAKKSGR